MGPKKAPRLIHMTAELMLAAYREQNPDHEEEFKKHKAKTRWQLKKEIDALATKEPRFGREM